MILGTLLTFLSACGGGSSNSSVKDITGTWTGTIQLDQEKSCVPPESQFLNLSGKTYTLEVSPLDAENRKVVIDQTGALYEQYYPFGIQDGEFSVNSTEQDFTSRTPTGPTGLSFPPNDGQTADVEVSVTYNRFCTVYFVGEFHRENIQRFLHSKTSRRMADFYPP